MNREPRREKPGSARRASPRARVPRQAFVDRLKLWFAALGAGTAVVPLGDNGRVVRRLAKQAAALGGR